MNQQISPRELEEIDIDAHNQLAKIDALVISGAISFKRGKYAKQVVWLDNSFNKTRWHARYGDVLESERLQKLVDIQVKAIRLTQENSLFYTIAQRRVNQLKSELPGYQLMNMAGGLN